MAQPLADYSRTPLTVPRSIHGRSNEKLARTKKYHNSNREVAFRGPTVFKDVVENE